MITTLIGGVLELYNVQGSTSEPSVPDARQWPSGWICTVPWLTRMIRCLSALKRQWEAKNY